MTGRLAAVGEALKRNAGTIGVEAGVNFVLPFLVYDLGRGSLGDVRALMASSVPPIAWSVFEFARRRKVDALSIIVLAGIALSLLAFVGGGGVQVLQLRERLVTGLVGLVFLGSAAIGRPLIYYLARATISRTSAEKAAYFESLREGGAFRRAMLVMTLAWGLGLVADCAICGALTFVLSIRQFLIVGPVIDYGLLALLTGWTYWFARRRIGPALHAAAQAADKTSGGVAKGGAA
jgi:hypothetical protein